MVSNLEEVSFEDQLFMNALDKWYKTGEWTLSGALTIQKLIFMFSR